MIEPNQNTFTSTGEAPPPWVQEMHEYFRENGFYRAEDLLRVLGDPRESVVMEASTELQELAKNICK